MKRISLVLCGLMMIFLFGAMQVNAQEAAAKHDKNNPLYVVSKITVKKDAIGAVKEAAAELVNETRKEEACILFTFLQNDKDPSVFVFYETWVDAASLEKHLETEHIKQFRAKVGSFIVDRELLELTKLN